MAERKSLYWPHGAKLLHGQKKHNRKQKDGILSEWVDESKSDADIQQKVADIQERIDFFTMCTKADAISPSDKKALKIKIKKLKNMIKK